MSYTSFNDGIPSHLWSVGYTSLNEAIRILHSCGVGALMAKIDIESAFRLLPVHPDNFAFWVYGLKVGIMWTVLCLWAVLFHVQPLNNLVPFLSGQLGMG